MESTGMTYEHILWEIPLCLLRQMEHAILISKGLRVRRLVEYESDKKELLECLQ